MTIPGIITWPYKNNKKPVKISEVIILKTDHACFSLAFTNFFLIHPGVIDTPIIR